MFDIASIQDSPSQQSIPLIWYALVINTYCFDTFFIKYNLEIISKVSIFMDIRYEFARCEYISCSLAFVKVLKAKDRFLLSEKSLYDFGPGKTTQSHFEILKYIKQILECFRDKRIVQGLPKNNLSQETTEVYSHLC